MVHLISNLTSTIESENHFKNGAGQKNQMNSTWMRRIILASVITQLIVFSCISCTSEKIMIQKDASEWWQPILQKHNLKLGAYNNFGNVFEIGMDGNSINNGICTLKVATVVVKNRDNSRYMIIEADTVYHNIREGSIEIISGIGKIYKIDSGSLVPSSTINGSWKTNLNSFNL